ncbi:MAG: helicase, phage-associated protein [Myxococcaceae bacterium]|nr:helicase, phage-associated protein [Myxococcaceae bacterium]
MNVTVMRDRYVRSWPDKPGKPAGERSYVMPLGKALTRSYTSDAHFTSYASPVGRRLSRDALSQTPVQMTCVVFDVDCDETHGSSQPAPEEWRQQLRAKMAGLHEDHPSSYFYETRGGARIVYTLSTSVVLTGPPDEAQWRQQYAVALAYLARRYGIRGDPACGDWTRLFRLPCATRDPAIGPECRLVVGDAGCIGPMMIKATTADVLAAKRATKVFDDRRVLSFEPSGVIGDGLLFHALSARGYVARQHDAKSYVVRCPNEAEHSSGHTADGSTLLYRSAAGEEVGAICCLHAHCSGLRVQDWLKMFSRSELDAARLAAGIKRSA